MSADIMQTKQSRDTQTTPPRPPTRQPKEERQNRDKTLDETVEDSFPASDPPSTTPNPNDPDAGRRDSTRRADTARR